MSDVQRNIRELLKSGNYDINVKSKFQYRDTPAKAVESFVSNGYYNAVVDYNHRYPNKPINPTQNSTNPIITKFNNIVQGI